MLGNTACVSVKGMLWKITNLQQKNKIDFFGAFALISLSALMGINHVIIKVVNSGLNPVFFAGLRSVLAFVFLAIYCRLANKELKFSRETYGISLFAGLVFALEFLLLFTALDFTTVSRNSILYYSMPIWAAILGHYLIPNDKLNALKTAGLVIAFTGVAIAISSDDESLASGDTQLFGDLLAILSAILWAIIIYLAKATKFKKVKPEMQLMWMLGVSGPILLLASPFFGDLIRNFEFLHLWGVIFQSTIVAVGAFLLWLWLVSIYPASGVASFSFLSPIFAIFFGWLLLGEILDSTFLLAASLVVIGLLCINKNKLS